MLSPEWKVTLTFGEKNIILHTNKIKKKNHIIILLDAEKTARNLQCDITVYILGIRQDSKTRDNKCWQGKGNPCT